MSEIEKIKQYICKNVVPNSQRYSMSMNEAIAVAHELDRIEAIEIAFIYGKAKGYKAAKAEMRRGQTD